MGSHFQASYIIMRPRKFCFTFKKILFAFAGTEGLNKASNTSKFMIKLSELATLPIISKQNSVQKLVEEEEEKKYCTKQGKVLKCYWFGKASFLH